MKIDMHIHHHHQRLFLLRPLQAERLHITIVHG